MRDPEFSGAHILELKTVIRFLLIILFLSFPPQERILRLFFINLKYLQPAEPGIRDVLLQNILGT